MDASFSNTLSATIAIVGAVLAWGWTRKQRTRRKNLPPGPSQEPVLGGLRSLPAAHHWLAFAEWGKVWGSLVYTSVFGTPIIVINSIDVARDLLDKRGAIYSDRPRSVVHKELMELDGLLSMHYGDRFRKHRRMISQVLNSQAINAYRELQMNSTRALLKSLLDDPADFDHHIKRQVYTTVVRVTYGLDVISENDPLLSLLAKMMDGIVSEGVSGLNVIDLFPILRYAPSWLPGCGFQNRISKTKMIINEAMNQPFDRTEIERAAGTSRASLVSNLLDDYEASGLDDPEHKEDIKSIASVMYTAGFETTVTTMLVFFQMMAKYPEVIPRAQAEIDAITHQERLPILDDRKDMPSIDCIMKEVFRINPAVPLGIPHRSTEKDEYNGFQIPEKSIVFTNIWQMMHDLHYFSHPDIFNPERFREKVERLGANSIAVLNGLDKDDPSAIVYGFGRRICPGRYFADASLWLTMANILAVFDIAPPLNAQSQPIVIGDIKYTSGVTSRPEPFECTIKPRNAKCAGLIRAAENQDVYVSSGLNFLSERSSLRNSFTCGVNQNDIAGLNVTKQMSIFECEQFGVHRVPFVRFTRAFVAY